MGSNFTNNFDRQLQRRQPLILVIDNDRDNLLFASCVIESLGFTYAVTEDSENCIDLVHELSPDMILLDIVMPNRSGLEITQIIRQDRNISHIPIIAVTGLTKAEDKTKLIAAGCNDYLCKPYLIEELESKIYAYLKFCKIQNQK